VDHVVGANWSYTSSLTRTIVCACRDRKSVSIHGPNRLEVSVFLARHNVRVAPRQVRSLMSLPIVPAEDATERVALRQMFRPGSDDGDQLASYCTSRGLKKVSAVRSARCWRDSRYRHCGGHARFMRAFPISGQYEASWVAVIGTQAENICRSATRSVASRLDDRQRHERAHLAAGRPTLWRAKNTDTFKPMGPWI